MTIQAYQTLYESSVAYGMRKALQAEQRKSEMLIKINQLNDNSEELEQEVDDLKRKIDNLLRQEKREKDLGEKRH
jgi:dynein light intermediate chain